MSDDATPLEKHGNVQESKYWRTKKIDDYRFEGDGVSPTADAIASLGPMVATVNLEIGDSNSDHEGKWIFIARSKWFPDIKETTLDVLKEKMAAAFRQAYLDQLGLKWTDWIEIKVSGRDSREWFGTPENSAGLRVSYDLVKRGRGPKGKDYIVDENGRLAPWPKPKAAGVEREGDGERFLGRYREGHYQDEDDQYTYIPATPVNLAGIKELLGSIIAVELRLQKFLDQKQVEKTLARVEALGLPKLEHKT